MPREKADALWNRFRKVQDGFYERRSRYYEERERERKANQRVLERLCSQAESLSHANDLKAAKQEVKQLQATWKATGPAPREVADALWSRFRRACDRVFEEAQRVHERKHDEWRERMGEVIVRKKEKIQRLEESIRHDEGNIDRWQDTIYTLRPGGRAGEIRYSLENKISSVRDKIRDKERSVDEVENTIRDIERKLAGY